MKSHTEGYPSEILIGKYASNNRLFTTIFAGLAMFTFSFTAYSQDQGYNSQQYENRQAGPVEQSIIPTIAPYSEDVRNNILIATQ